MKKILSVLGHVASRGHSPPCVHLDNARILSKQRPKPPPSYRRLDIRARLQDLAQSQATTASRDGPAEVSIRRRCGDAVMNILYNPRRATAVQKVSIPPFFCSLPHAPAELSRAERARRGIACLGSSGGADSAPTPSPYDTEIRDLSRVCIVDWDRTGRISPVSR